MFKTGLSALGFRLSAGSNRFTWALVATVFTITLPVFAQAPVTGPEPRAQSPEPVVERVSFEEAVRRALASNPTIAQAGEAVLRAQGLLQQARAATLPGVNVSFSNATLDSGRVFNGVITQPRNQGTLSADLSMPLLAMSRWAAANQARDQIEVATLSTADVRKQIGIATGQTYLAIIAQRRQLDVNMRAREAAAAHLDYADRRLAQGAGTRLNQLRAAQEVATDDARLENARLGVRRAQEALGVLMAAGGPVDAIAEPTFEIPPADAVSNETAWMEARPDLRLSIATERAFERVYHDSFKDYFPTATATFAPQSLMPSGVFTAPRSWRFAINVSQPVFDGGQRKGLSKFREAAANASRLALNSLQIQARSEVRLAQEVVQSNERALVSVRLAAQQADEVLSITNTAFEAGATTNLEVIDAQRTARDSESAVAVAEDAVRTARLALLVALGRFPQ